ncbi:MAG TPA: DNA primase [bacterium]|nr:DNA primase [bacterium]
MQIPRDIIDDVRNRTSLAEVIGKHVTLTRAGTSLKGLCPFHGEKTPSFNVQEAKGVWHCFGCGEGGDVFKFLMKIENRSFVEVVEDLAERVGVTIPKAPLSPAEQEARSEADEMFLANEKAKGFFINQLAAPVGKAARDYLVKRGIGRDLIEEYGLGYCGPGWDGLARWWVQQKLDPRSGVKAGLFTARREGKQGHYDRFHERLTFTISNSRGRVIGFGGRKLEGETTAGDQAPKYLNSSESPVYKKSEALYGLDAARVALGKHDRVIVVEGYFDVLGMAQAGIREVVATCGTALTPQHLNVIRRYTKNVVLLYDGDDAGRNAAKRSVPLFFEAGLSARFYPLPQGEDPDTWAQKIGQEKALETLARATPLADFYIDEFGKKARTLPVAERATLLKKVAPVFAKVTDALELGDYAHRLADHLGFKDEQVLAVLRGATPSALGGGNGGDSRGESRGGNGDGDRGGSDARSSSGGDGRNSSNRDGGNWKPDFKRAGGPSGKPAWRPRNAPPEPFGGPMPTADLPISAKRAVSNAERNSEETVLRLMLGSRRLADKVRADKIFRLFKDEDLQRVGDKLAEALARVGTRGANVDENSDQPDVAAALDLLDAEGLPPEDRRLILSLSANENLPFDPDAAGKDFLGAVTRLEQRELRERKRELRLELDAASRAQDEAKVLSLAAEIAALDRQVKR